jgi:predicted PhzF superfamily epimerase YddE/YHI9
MSPLPNAIPLDVVDAFSDQPFRGNPASVCCLQHEADAGWMQSLAAEMNHSETAFVWPTADCFQLRWFTPTVEVDLCGHATLAAAHVLWERGLGIESQDLRFLTKSGVLLARRSGPWIELDFPAERTIDAQAPPELALALGARAVCVQRNRMDWLVELESEQAVRGLQPDFEQLARIPTRGVIVTAQSSGEFDFVSRFFAPASGVSEDPVTGSAHCALGPYWSTRLHKRYLVGLQVSQRPGIVRVDVHNTRVLLSGQALTIVRGELSAAAVKTLRTA